MNNERTESLREAAWRRPLTEAERAELAAWLAAQPETRTDWQAEDSLNKALRRLPDVPMPSNFTARVLQAVEREEAAAGRARKSAWRSFDVRRWLPRFAVGAVAVVAVLVSVHSYTIASRAKIVQSVAVLSEITPSPSPDLLADFDSIRKLNAPQGADTELLDLLQ
jgi:anti-sigma factor RsiW